MPYAKVREGCTHRVARRGYDPNKPDGRPGPRANAGEVIRVSEQELASFSDKLERVNAPDDEEGLKEPGEASEAEDAEQDLAGPSATEGAVALANLLEIDLGDVTGSSSEGKIVKRDVERFAKAQGVM